tara:strand:+ start:3182 stop:3442 length:261 start_codon:yes stop_codon:yes gene_type:complete
MEIARDTTFEWQMNFTPKGETEPVSITWEVIWTKAWDFGETKLFRLERWVDGKMTHNWYKTETEIIAGLLDADKEIEADTWTFVKK